MRPRARHLLAAALAALAAPPALADAPQDEYALPPVVVEGERPTQELAEDRAAAGTVLEGPALERTGQALPEVLDAQPGVRVQRLGGPGSLATLSIRGSSPEQVLVTLDGVPLNDAAGGPVDLSRLPVGNLARVEIYRGVSPVAFGASAIGGVLALETQSGGRRRLEATVSGGSWWERGVRLFGADVFGAGDVAVGIDYAGARGDFTYWNDGGTRFDASDDTRVQRQNAAFDQVSALAKGRLFLGPHVALTLLDWTFWRTQGLPGLGLYETRRAHLAVLENLAALRVDAAGLADDRLDVGVTASFRLADTRLSDPLSEIGLAADDSRDRALVPDVRGGVTVRILPAWDARASAGWRYERFAPSEAGAGLVPSDRHAGFAALESGVTVAPLGLLIVPSGRVEVALSQLTARAVDAPSESSHRDVAATWRLSLVQKAGADTQLTLAGGSAARFPSLFELFGNTGAVKGNPQLVPESSLGLDAGARSGPRPRLRQRPRRRVARAARLPCHGRGLATRGAGDGAAPGRHAGRVRARARRGCARSRRAAARPVGRGRERALPGPGAAGADGRAGVWRRRGGRAHVPRGARPGRRRDGAPSPAPRRAGGGVPAGAVGRAGARGGLRRRRPPGRGHRGPAARRPYRR